MTAAIVGNVLTISGTPTDDITTQTIYNYTVTTIGTCADTSLSGTITVDPDDDLDLISAAGTDAQVLCETDPLVAIDYEFSAGATSATVSGLPLGVTAAIVGNVLTISGTPTDDITTQTVYNYTVTTIGTCADTSLSGTITVDPDDDLDLISAVGTDAQVLCETDPLVAIDYEFSAGATSATVSTLPAGVTSAIVGNVLTISGTPTDDITTQTIYNYTVTTIGTCADTSLSGTITVDPEGGLDLISATGTDAQILCEDTPIALIEYQLLDGPTGATVTGLPAGIGFNVLNGIVTISGTPIVNITTQTVYTYEITTTGSLCSGSITGTITIDPDDDLSLISAVGTDSQVLCEGDPIDSIIYQFSAGATSANITGLPLGVTFSIINDLVTISGTPSVNITTQTVYPYTITTIGTCADTSLSGTITVDAEGGLVLTSPTGTDSQILCEDTPIAPIEYQLLDGATGAAVTGLPAGIGFNVLNGIVTISGTPADDITATTVYNYSVTTTGSCSNSSLLGSITLEPNDDLELISAVGTESQVLCETEPLVDIGYEFSAGATSATVSTLPAGVTFAIVGNVLTISGTPTDNITTQTVYPYTITTLGGTCNNTSLDGTITVNPEGGLVLTSPTGTDAQVVCENSDILDITYQLVDGATGATVTGLPAGISFSFVSDIITMSGFPTVNITSTTVYNYTITTTGSSCSGTTTGTITVDPDDDLALISPVGSESQVLCETEPLVDIVYEFSAGATSATVSGLPTGVNFVVATNQVTIFGTPDINITTQTIYPYTVTTLGGTCQDTSLDGTITVNPEGIITLTSPTGTDAQVVCETQPITDITYQLFDGATDATATGLPAGVSFSVDLDIVTISGTPTDDVTSTTVYDYTITTTGGCSNTSLSGTITVNPDDDLAIVSIPGTDEQILCETEPLVDIVYEFSGGATSATVTGLPAGVTFVVAGNELTISGTPTGPILTQTIFDYTVTTIGTCQDASLDGTITVNPQGGLVLTSPTGSDAQVVCENTPILDITYQLEGDAINATVTGLPAGSKF